MVQLKDTKKSQPSKQKTEVMRLSVAGFKSISQKQSIEIRPLTILAGANSSGKTSMVQPLLLLKQTLEETYDPGALLLSGPNVKFTSMDQLFSHLEENMVQKSFEIGISIGPAMTITLSFHKDSEGGIDIKDMEFVQGEKRVDFRLGMPHEEISAALSPELLDLYEYLSARRRGAIELTVIRERCFLEVVLQMKGKTGRAPLPLVLVDPLETKIRGLIHVPGLRGNPERTYPVTAVGSAFPGTFEKYVASVIAQWQAKKDHEKLVQLNKDLERLGLTWKVTAKPVNDTQVELQVGRLPTATRGGAHDLVSIADVGFGVSQTLPVLVALHVAEPGQLVYLEQPEIHLHPRAQSAMTQILADAANRGVRVIAETHSNLLLLGVQTLVAEGKLAPGKVKLHWFRRDSVGNTKIASTDLDEAGAFGDWPEDFSDVALEAESRYLDVTRTWGVKNGYGGKKVEAPRH